MPIEVVFFDVGGPLYGDRPFYEALWRAISEARPDAREDSFWEEFERIRRGQLGPMTQSLAGYFVEDQRAREEVILRARSLWRYPRDVLQADAPPVVESLARRYRLGVLANQQPWIRETLSRDGLAEHFSYWSISAEIGSEKPDPRIFDHALEQAGTSPDRCVMVGDRLDNDVIPAKAAGMRTVWLLRGEAPDDPTAEQLAEPDAAIRALGELDAVLGRL